MSDTPPLRLQRTTLWVMPRPMTGSFPHLHVSVLRSALGPALRQLACTEGCDPQQGCSREAPCAWGLAFPPSPGLPAPIHLDATGLLRTLRPDQAVPVHVVQAGEPIPRLVAGVRLALARGLGPKDRRIRFDVQQERTDHPDPIEIADRWQDLIEVESLTPLDLVSTGDDPLEDLRPLVVSVWRRARSLGMNTDHLPRFDGDSPLPARCLYEDRVERAQWSSRQRGAYPVEGRLGRWLVHASAADRPWLALASLIGAGRGASRGMGVLRCVPLDVPPLA